MKVQTDIKYELTVEDIEQAIKEYIEKISLNQALDFRCTKVDFNYKDDDDRGPYRLILRIASCVVTPSFLD
jgi:hypothetical protein